MRYRREGRHTFPGRCQEEAIVFHFGHDDVQDEPVGSSDVVLETVCTGCRVLLHLCQCLLSLFSKQSSQVWELGSKVYQTFRMFH